MNFRTALKTLLVLVLGLPLVQAVFLWVSGLLSAMGDDAVGTVLEYVSKAVGILWLLSLVGLIITLALQTLDEPRDPGA